MKKTLICILTALIILTMLVSCDDKEDKGNEKEEATTAEQAIAETVCGTYCRKNANEIDSFTITLNENGTYSYFETMISSHFGMGEYTVEGETVIIIDEQIPGVNGSLTHTYKFKYVDGKLIFLAAESDKFMYIDLPDGATFERVLHDDSTMN